MEKYRLHFQHENTGSLISKEFTIDELIDGTAKLFIDKQLPNYYLIGKSLFTGKFDSKGNCVYQNDIIEFDDDVIYRVEWNNKHSEWSYGCGTATEMEYRKVIGNKFNNLELWNSL